LRDQEIIETLIFELNNLKIAKQAMQLEPRNFASADDYARAAELLEFQTWQRTSIILDTLVQEKVLDSHKRPNVSQEQYLLEQDMRGHTDLYKKDWIQECDPGSLAAWRAANVLKWQKNLEKLQQKRSS